MDHIAKIKVSFFENLKANINDDEVIILGRFSQNLFIVQDKIPEYH